MSNTFSKLQFHKLPGALFTTAVNETNVVFDSRIGEKTYFSRFDLQSGHLLHEKEASSLTPWHTLVGIQDDLLNIQHFENHKNPDMVTHFQFDPSKNTLTPNVPDPNHTDSIINTPLLYSNSSPDFKLFQQFIGENIVLACEYQEVGNKLIFSYYLSAGAAYIRRLRILANKKIVYDEVQDDGMKGFAPGSFFTFKNRLIFAQHKREINIYEI